MKAKIIIEQVENGWILTDISKNKSVFIFKNIQDLSSMIEILLQNPDIEDVKDV